MLCPQGMVATESIRRDLPGRDDRRFGRPAHAVVRRAPGDAGDGAMPYRQRPPAGLWEPDGSGPPRRRPRRIRSMPMVTALLIVAVLVVAVGRLWWSLETDRDLDL